MKKDRDTRESRPESRIASSAFESFITHELLPQVGLRRQAFDDLLNQLGQPIDAVQSELPQPGLVNTAQGELLTGEVQAIQWGSLYSALYDEDAIPHCAGLRAGQKTNPARTRRVTSSVKDFLDIAFPMTDGSHHDVTSYLVYFQNLMMILADGSTAGLQNPTQFVGKIGPRENPESILLLQNGQHVELRFDPCGAVGSIDLAGINDVQVEVAGSSCSDLEAHDIATKIERYRELMRIAFAHTDRQVTLASSDFTAFTGKCGDLYKVTHSGHIVYINTSHSIDEAMLYGNPDTPIATSQLDTLIATLIAAGANRTRSMSDAEYGPRIIVVSDNNPLTLQLLNSAERACRKSRTPRRSPLPTLQNCENAIDTDTAENPMTGHTRATQLPLPVLAQSVSPKHNCETNSVATTQSETTRSEPNCSGINRSKTSNTTNPYPSSNQQKAATAGTRSINQAVLTTLHYHGFELARLSRSTPGDNVGGYHPLLTRVLA